MVQRIVIESALVLALCLTSFACSGDDDNDKGSSDGEPDKAGEMASEGEEDDDDASSEEDDEDASSDDDDDPSEGANDDASAAGDADDDASAEGDAADEGSDLDAGMSDEDDMADNGGGTDPLPPIDEDKALPIVFVHGYVGSAQQFSSQAIRYVANGYPAERLRAFDHDGLGGPDAVTGFISGLDAVINEVRQTFEVDQVYLIGHSRGTFVSSTYLGDAAQAEKVAKYISLDGSGCGMIPMTVPCISPSQESRGGTHPLPGQRHVEVATSKESFAVQWEFLFGEAPEVVDIVKQRAPVEISGRAVNFPANTGREGTILSIWELDGDTGMRAVDEPLAEFDIDESGDWGPVTVDPDAYYELVLGAEDDDRFHHFYMQRFLRSDQFVRLLSGPPDSDARVNTNTGEGHSALTVSRMREWTQDDVLDVGSKSADSEQEPVNVVTMDLKESISIFLHDDAATPGETTLAPLPWFNDQAFQAGLDLYMPASDPPNGTITLTNYPRGDMEQPQTLHVPNWRSTNHSVSVVFADFPQPQD